MNKVISALLFICLGVNPQLPAYAEPGVVPAGCGQTSSDQVNQWFIFSEPDDEWTKQSLPCKKDLMPWPPAARRKLSMLLCDIEWRAPGLVANAINGQAIHLTLETFRDCPEYGDAVMVSEGGVIAVSPTDLSCSNQQIEEDLVHELAHEVDAEGCLTWDQQWIGIICGSLKEALVDYTAAIAIDPEYSDPYEHRAQIYAQQGKIELSHHDDLRCKMLRLAGEQN